MANKKRHKQKQEKALPTDARADPLTHAFKEYWRNVDAGKSHTNAAIFVMRDYGIEMNDKQFRRCARRVKNKIGEIRGREQGERDYHLIEHLVRHRYKEPVASWDEFDAAFHACGLPRTMLRGVKQFLQACGMELEQDGASAVEDRPETRSGPGSSGS